MKKTFLSLGLAVAALTLTNCNKEADFAGADATPVKIALSLDDTKTVNNGLKTAWADGDALSVWVANDNAPALDYGSNLKFDVDPASSTASGTVELASSNSWFAIYPYDSHLVNPTSRNEEGAQKGYLTLGSAAKASQTQNGNNSTAHLAGPALPLYGVARSVPASEAPSLLMKQIAGVLAINVTNESKTEITVSSVAVTASTDLVGTYYVDFSGNLPELTPSGENYVSATASLAVQNGTALAPGASAKFYLAVKPFQGTINTIKVVADAGECEKSPVTYAVNVDLQAGHIKTVNFVFDSAEQVQTSSLRDIQSMDDNSEVVTNAVQIVAKADRGILLAENGLYLFAYGASGAFNNYNVGDIVQVSGTKSTYKDMPQLNNPVVTLVNAGGSVSHPTPEDITSSFDNFTSTVVTAVKYTGTLSVSGNYYNVNVAGAEAHVGSFLVPASNEVDAVKAMNGKTVEVTGYFIYFSSKYLYVIATSIVETGDAPAATLSSIAVSGQQTSFNVGDNFVFGGTVTATYSDNSTKDVTSSASFSGYEMTKAGTYEVTVTYSEGNVTKTATYQITVAAQDDPNVNTLTKSMSDYVANNQCTVSAGSEVTIYDCLDLSGAVRMYTTGEANCGSFWNTSATNDTKQWRLYENKGGDVTIQVADGCNLVSVKITYATTNNGILKDAAGADVKSNDVYETSGTSVTFQVKNTSESATNGQVRITEVEVKYTGSGTLPPYEKPDAGETTTSISMPNNASVYVGETISLNASANVQATITYESEDTSIATVNANGDVTGVAVGTVKVYARVAGVPGSYTAAERYCNVTVSTKTVQTDGTVVFDQTYLAANQNGQNGVISYTSDSNYGSTSVTELRIYKNSHLTVTASSGKTITSIKFTCTANGTEKQGPGSWGDGAPEGYSFEANGPTGTWTGSAQSVSFTASSNQVRIKEMVVTYE